MRDPVQRDWREAITAGSGAGDPAGSAVSTGGLLHGLEPDEVELVRRHWLYRRLDPGEILFQQGERHAGVFLVRSGIIRTYYGSAAGRQITLAYWQAGKLVGSPNVFGACTHIWSGEAIGETEVYFLPGPALRSLAQVLPSLAINLVEALEEKGACFSILIQMLATHSVTERLAQLLVTLCGFNGFRAGDGPCVISADLTHEDLAHMVGASRQWVTSQLRRFQDQDILRVQRKSIVVKRPDRLREIAQAGE